MVDISVGKSKCAHNSERIFVAYQTATFNEHAERENKETYIFYILEVHQYTNIHIHHRWVLKIQIELVIFISAIFECSCTSNQRCVTLIYVKYMQYYFWCAMSTKTNHCQKWNCSYKSRRQWVIGARRTLQRVAEVAVLNSRVRAFDRSRKCC